MNIKNNINNQHASLETQKSYPQKILINNKLKNIRNNPKQARSDSIKITGKYKNISLKKTFQNKIWIIKISRPDVENAIDKQTATELNSVFKDFDSDKNSLVAILSGKGKSFCSGADLSNIAAEIDSLKQNNFYLNFSENQQIQNQKNLNNSKINEISEKGDGPLGVTRLVLNKPVIAAVNGPAVAGGFELLLWCDLRVAYGNCEMGFYCRKRGVPLIDGGTYRLQQLIGLSRAMDLVLTGRRIDGNEAFGWGLVNRICEDKWNVMREAKKLAVELCALPQDCLRNDRMSLLEIAYSAADSKGKVKVEFDYGIKSLRSNEMKEAVNEFLKKKTNKKMLPKF